MVFMHATTVQCKISVVMSSCFLLNILFKHIFFRNIDFRFKTFTIVLVSSPLLHLRLQMIVGFVFIFDFFHLTLYL